MLVEVNNSYVLGLIEGILKENCVPYYVKGVESAFLAEMGVWGYGMSPAQIIIRESDTEKAKNLVETVFPQSEPT
ncbi:MAG: hypothetical protein RsTaC01_0329 [Candidatus Paraimprobicoccus trichonymphae]|uniref:DUF2007 domain-containing protein n=1 Tax=Candidatus Paraimprobicoccus trichonymphae TaxID=3033793 RepID=A0AA48IHB5_9FIRM|nr:MAG: hypothetical protein RsTaC01_0329 [Candidatus Paraimprobicoccus trichonymphae]